ncbi:MAG: DUF58 domain-containing protein [Fervidobacterium sp.]
MISQPAVSQQTKYNIWTKYSPFVYVLLLIVMLANIFAFNKYILATDFLVAYVFYDYFKKRRAIEKIEIMVKARARVFTNEEFQVEFIIKSPQSLFITITPPLLINKEPREILLNPNEEQSVIYTSKLGTRGTKQLGTYSIKIEGFGKLFSIIRSEFINSDVKVLPNMEESNIMLERIWESLPNLKSSYKLAEDISYVKDLREYNNDPFNKIHWKKSVKYDKLIVKDFEYTGTGKILILLDLNLPGTIYSKNAWFYIRKKYEEDAIKAATGLINYFSGRHEQVYLYTSGGKGFQSIKEKDPVIYFDYLAEVQGTIENEKDTTELLAEILAAVQPVDTVVILSMLLTTDEVKEIIHLKSRCGRVVVLLMPYGYRDATSKKFRSYYDVPPEVKQLYNYAKILRDENVLISIWHENVSLMEGLKTIEESSWK